VVVSSLRSDASILGYARKGDRFRAIGQTEQWYKIQFFNALGWVERSNAVVAEPGAAVASEESGWAAQNASMIITIAIIIGGLILLAGGYIAYRLLWAGPKLPPVRIPTARSGLIIAPRSKARGDDIDNSAFLKDVLAKIGFEVTTSHNILEVKNILLHYLPDVILVDWRFDTNINSTIQHMLAERTSMAHILVIFYNTVDAFSIKKNPAFINTHYLSASFTAKEIYKLITPLINSDQHVETNAVPRKNLEGEIDKDSLPEIFQFIELGKKNGCLMIELEKPFGMIFFEQGQIVYATTINGTGINAVYEVLNLKKGTFKFIVDKAPKTKNIHVSTFEVLMEWAKVSDEATKIVDKPA
jgi:hypothetical protein